MLHFDYVTEGREANTILVESGDGFRFDESSFYDK